MKQMNKNTHRYDSTKCYSDKKQEKKYESRIPQENLLMFSYNIKMLAKHNGKTVLNVACECNIDNNSMNAYANGISCPKEEHMNTLCKYFDVDEEDFFSTNIAKKKDIHIESLDEKKQRFSKGIRVVLERRGLSVKKAAKKCHIEEEQFQQYVKGTAYPQHIRSVRIREGLGLSKEEIAMLFSSQDTAPTKCNEETLAGRCRNLRKREGLSFRELAFALQVSQASIQQLEQGLFRCPRRLMAKYAEYFHVTEEWLLVGDDKKLQEKAHDILVSQDKKVLDYFLETNVMTDKEISTHVEAFRGAGRRR